MDKLSIDQLRREYLQGGLNREQLDDCPITQFELWLKQAVDAQLQDPTAMTLATVDASGQPSQRIVLLKAVNDGGFVFFTNYGSRKAKEIAANQKVSLHFPWHSLERQVKVAGVARKVSHAESLQYFLSRPEESQLAAWASEQSRPVSSRQLLMQQFASMKEKFAAGKIPLPDFWGGFRVEPQRVEFWQGGANRLHDRFEYTRQDKESWEIQRLAP